MKKYYIQRLSDGAYYSARPGVYMPSFEARWSAEFEDVRLYRNRYHAERTINELLDPNTVEIKEAQVTPV
jgi:hypothetical protein